MINIYEKLDGIFFPYFAQHGFKTYSKCTYLRLSDNCILQCVSFTKIAWDDCYVIDVFNHYLYTPKMKSFHDGTMTIDLGRRIEYLVDGIEDKSGKFYYNDPVIFESGVIRLKKGFEEVVFPWFEDTRKLSFSVKLMQTEKFRKPDIGWRYYDIFFTLLYMKDYNHAKEIGTRIFDDKILRFPESEKIFMRYFTHLNQEDYDIIAKDFEETIAFNKQCLKLKKKGVV